MAFPFPSPFKVPLPRRFVLLALSASILILFLNLFAPSTFSSRYSSSSSSSSADSGYFTAGKWLPSIWKTESAIDRPPEFDEDGQCLFLSPYDALSPEEKRRAEMMVLEEVSAGVVRAKNMPESAAAAGGATRDGFEYADEEDLARYTNISSPDWTPRGQSHPILALLKNGEDKWNKKLQSQSRTLEEAVEKYAKKWNRNPPKGFDRWWKFATSVNVFLIDEYDAIMTSLLPFYGLPIKTLSERLKEAETIPETFTLIVHDGKVELQWNDDYSRDTWWASRPRADSQINLMEPFLNLLPSFRATFTIHDQPTMLLDYARQQELVSAAKAGKVSTHVSEEDRFEQIWAKACPPDSPLAKGEVESPETDTFISRHAAAMDICQHPSLILQYMENHGMLLEAHDENMHPKPHTKLYPILVPSKTSLNGDIPVTPIGRDGRRDDVGHDPDWSRKSGKLYWRGLATGLNHNKQSGAKWRQSHRERLHFLANDRTNANQEILSVIGETGESELSRYPKKELGEYYMDVKLSGGHWQCDWDDGTCDEMNAEIEWAEQDSTQRGNDFKYVFDTDGNAWSSRFPRLMASNNVVIKSSVFPEWNTQSLPEWFAYVPSKMDYSDLFSIMAFFRGTPSGKGAHDEVARRIALNSQCWVEKTWRREDMQSYMFLLYIEYARLISPDRDNGKMDYISTKKHGHPVPAAEPETAKAAAPPSAMKVTHDPEVDVPDITAEMVEKIAEEELDLD